MKLLMTLVLLVLTRQALASELTAQRIKKLELKETNAGILALNFNVPLGLEIEGSPKGTAPKARAMTTMSLENVTLAEALDAISTKTGSEWVEENGFINVIPSGKRKSSNYVLNRMVPNTTYENMDRDQMVAEILNGWAKLDPSIKVERTELGILMTHGPLRLELISSSLFALQGLHNMGATPPELPKHTISFVNQTLRQALNRLSQFDGVWWAANSSDDSNAVTIQFQSHK